MQFVMSFNAQMFATMTFASEPFTRSDIQTPVCLEILSCIRKDRFPRLPPSVAATCHRGKFLRCICSCASSLDVVATHFRIHDLTLHTSWTLSNSENQLSTVARNLSKACLNHSFSFWVNRSCGIEDVEEKGPQMAYTT